jgi:hypothetical protein
VVRADRADQSIPIFLRLKGRREPALPSMVDLSKIGTRRSMRAAKGGVAVLNDFLE